MPVHFYALFFVLGGYMVLNRGFAHLGLHPFYIGEFVIGIMVLGLMASRDTKAIFDGFIREPAGKITCSLLVLFCVHSVFGELNYGTESYRDAIILFYVIFAFFGYIVGRDPTLLARYLKLLSIVFPVVFVYALTYPFGESVRAISPTVNASADAHLFGHYAMTYAFVIGGIFYYLLMVEPGPWRRVCIIVGIASLLVLFSRAGYLTFALLLLFWKVLNLKFTRRIKPLAYTAIVLALVGVLGMAGFHLSGYDRFKVSLPNVAQRFVSIFSDGYIVSEEMAGWEVTAQGTKNHRITWAKQSMAILIEDDYALFFGKGFGFNLGEVIGFSAAIRYVHNSYVTVVVLTGLLGLAVLLLFHGVVIRRTVILLRRATTNDHMRRLVAFLLLFHLAFLVLAVFGTLLEAPFQAANLYFVSGICIAITRPAAVDQYRLIQTR